jgi:hypothetical protein
MSTEIKSIPIDKISAPREGQTRVDMNWETVTDYAEAMASQEVATVFPPIITFFDGELYHLSDGYHRLHACKKNGYTNIKATVYEGNAKDALWAAAAANLKNASKCTREDRKRAAVLLIECFPERSSNSIAKQCGMDHKTIEAYRNQLGNFPSQNTGPSVRVGDDGRTCKVKATTKAEPKKDQPRKNEFTEPEVTKPVVVRDVSKDPNTPMSVGLMWSRNAIVELMKISPDDTQKLEGFALVTQYIAENS